MLFYILGVVVLSLVGFWAYKMVRPTVHKSYGDTRYSRESGFVALAFAFLFTAVIFGIVHNHAGDVAKVRHQHALIEVYQEQVDEMNERLAAIDPPASALLNADTPVSSMVAALSEWQGRLAQSKAQQAHAIIDIEARKLGLMSGVVTVFGDYK